MLKHKKIQLKRRPAVSAAWADVVRDSRGKWCYSSSSHSQITGGWAQGMSHRGYLLQYCLLYRGRQQKMNSENWMTQGTNNRRVSSAISFDLFQLSNELLTSDNFSVLHVNLVDGFIHFTTGDYQPEIQNEIESSASWFNKKQKPQGIPLRSSGNFGAK